MSLTNCQDKVKIPKMNLQAKQHYQQNLLHMSDFLIIMNILTQSHQILPQKKTIL